MRKILTFIFVALLPLVANAYDAEINGICYNFWGSEATVTYRDDNYNSYSGAIVIPESVTYNGKTYSVTSIGNNAFYNCSGLASINIPNSVTTIGQSAFHFCIGLKSVTIPNSVTSIGKNAFYVCNGLTSITIPNSVKTLGDHVFDGCKGLKSVSMEDGVTSIGNYAFELCTALTSINIPESVTSIGENAFQNCSSLVSINIPDSEGSMSIGSSAFSRCESLKTITIGNSVTSIGQNAFYDCSSLTSVHITDLAAWCKIVFWDYLSNPLVNAKHLYLNGEEVTELVIPVDVTSIGEYAFYGCSSITSIIISDNVTKIGANAFDGTSWYNNQPNGVVYLNNVVYKYKGVMPENTQIVIKEGTSLIANSAFSDYKSLTSVTIPSSMKIIGGRAFEGCTGLTSVNITDLSAWCKISFSYNPLFYAHHLYLNGKEITELVIPEDVISISGGAFEGCSNITSVTIHERVIKIGAGAFDGTSWYENQPNGVVYANKFVYKYKGNMPASTKIEIKDGTLGIANSAFLHARKKLLSVTFPNSLKFIGSSVFKNSTYLSSISIPNSVISIGENAFENTAWYDSQPDGIVYAGKVAYSYKGEMPERAEILIKDGTLGIADAAFRDCFDLTSATICSSVVHIGSSAFPQTSSLKFNVKDNSITLISLWNAGYEDNIYDVETTKKIEPLICKITASSIKRRSIDVTGANKLSENFYINDHMSDGLTILGLEPDTEVNAKYSVELQYGNETVTYKKDEKVKTNSLSLATLQPKVISDGNVILAAKSNLDDEETNVGFEWRRIDWTDDFDSKTGGAYLYEGMMEGYIRSLNSKYLWKFRPYYTSGAGNSYYGEWKGLDPSDYSYFEPTVHTYTTINVDGNSAEVKGYVMRGTDNITSQGFMYWSTNHASSRRHVNSIPNDAKTILASGNVMTATLADLEYETEYCCVAFVTTSEGETFYGESQIFQTGGDPDGIYDVKATGEGIEVARYNLQGHRLSAPQKGINIIRYSDGTSKKVLVK